MNMERRGYFVFGDVLASAAAGAAAGWLSWLAIPAGWTAPVWVAIGLILGMILGMVTGMVFGILFMPFFGAMEIVVPAMLSGLLAGMATGMLQPMTGIGAAEALLVGAVIGLACLTYTYALQAQIGGAAI